PLLQLHGADDGCILPPQVDDRHRFAAPHARQSVPDVGHFLHIEAPRRSRNGSRHGPSSGSLDLRGETTGMGGAGRTLTWGCTGRGDGGISARYPEMHTLPTVLLVLVDRYPGRLAAVNLGLGDLAPQRLPPTATCLDTARNATGSRQRLS